MPKLKVGDVVQLPKGFAVYYRNHEVEIGGKPAEWQEYEESSVKQGGKVYSRRDLVTKKLSAPGPGEFVVVAARLQGGGTGHGPHDVYPDGWNVTLRRLTADGKWDPEGTLVSFYQSGCFTIMHESVPVLRKMEQKFV